MKKTIGGDRIGSGSKMQVELHHYERSTHDLGYLWRSTMSSGTLVPFLSEVALPGDTFDINLDCDIKTHPTIGPLFGSYKVQLDVYLCPVRLYQGQLHNNKLGIGMNMAAVKLPQILLRATIINDTNTVDFDNAQINPSSILSYLGIRGVGMTTVGGSDDTRSFNAIPLLAYWDIYKNYYANKQEELGAVIHSEIIALVENIETLSVDGANIITEDTGGTPYTGTNLMTIFISLFAFPQPLEQIILDTSAGAIPLSQVLINQIDTAVPASIQGNLNFTAFNGGAQAITIFNWHYISATEIPITPPNVVLFDLNNLDEMREAILTAAQITTPFILNAQNLEPYSLLLDLVGTRNAYMQTQEGLAIKTYQSDLFNNWLSTEWIDGAGGINEITAIDTSGGSFEIPTLLLARKVYDMLNRVAISGGSYDDWLDVNWTSERFTRAETPIYCGGLIKELVFQEVVSNSEGGGEDTANQPLGTLAGKGVLAKKHKGGHITIKVDEPGYIIGLISLTPRIDYSQGNKWDTHLLTMDDFHKPALDEIGFQELIQEQMAWWTTAKIAGVWTTKSAGKQPAWINYMTNVNQTKGNFAIQDNEMFMTLNRRYEWNDSNIDDLTTYIDPVKFNNIFAETSLDAQNFWAQIAVDITGRRKMSAKIMPNL